MIEGGATAVNIRDYSPLDEEDWLRCRVLGFLPTAYFDDVLTKKPTYDGPAVEIVAASAGAVVGIIDVAVTDELATIETVAVRPDVARRGIGSLFLGEVLRRLPSSVRDLDIVETRQGLTPVAAFFHADISREDDLRGTFSRVHVCRRYVRSLDRS